MTSVSEATVADVVGIVVGIVVVIADEVVVVDVGISVVVPEADVVSVVVDSVDVSPVVDKKVVRVVMPSHATNASDVSTMHRNRMVFFIFSSITDGKSISTLI
jgi:hypothetical protein